MRDAAHTCAIPAWYCGGVTLLPSRSYQVHLATELVTHGNQHYLYYTGLNERHDCASLRKQSAIGVATLPLDRFVAWSTVAGSATGWLRTPSFQLPSGTLRLNLDCGREGAVAVELLWVGEGGRALGSCETGEGVDSSAWPCYFQHAGKGALPPAAVAVQLMFRLHGSARLFAFQFAPP